MHIKNNLVDFLSFLIVITLMFIFIITPMKISSGIADGIMICGNVLIPSMFPFIVLSLILTESGILKRLCKNSFTFSVATMILSVLGGYPIGAKIIAETYEKEIISKKFAEKLLYVSINAGPSFIITIIGQKALGNRNIGFFLFFAHILSTIQMFLVTRPYKKESIMPDLVPKKSFSETFVTAVALSSTAMMSICSYVILFSGLINFINQHNEKIKLIISFLEITNAVLNNKNIYALSFFLGFSGICVILQIISISKNYIKNPFKIIASRIMHGILSIINLKILLLIFPQFENSLSNSINFNFKAVTENTLYSLFLIAFSIIFIYSLQKKSYCGKIIKDIW